MFQQGLPVLETLSHMEKQKSCPLPELLCIEANANESGQEMYELTRGKGKRPSHHFEGIVLPIQCELECYRCLLPKVPCLCGSKAFLLVLLKLLEAFQQLKRRIELLKELHLM